MGILTIDGHVLKKAIIAGANELDSNRAYIDSLNVFPVPDGDTGINMSLTVIAAAKEVEKLNTPNVYDIAKAASNGSLRGARGNSGVILSQLFRGFAKGLEGKSTANAEDIADAFVKGMETAYKAVMKPKEGTILTVARAIGEYAVELAFDIDDIEILLRETIENGRRVLAQTQEMLPELKQAGVVDAGGMGLLKILEGAYNSRDMEGDITINAPSDKKESAPATFSAVQATDIEFGYCTEFFINLEKVTDKIEDSFRNYLKTIGDSIVVAGDEDIIKVHVHTNHPGQVIEKAITIGSLSNMKIDNMRLQHTNLISFAETTPPENNGEPAVPGEKKELGFISVSMGAGFSELFKSLGTDQIIEGGQTMNPSTEDILCAVDKVHADNIVILPNNKNIILAAEQAAKLSNKNIYVIPSKTVPQGIAAIINYTIGADLEENIAQMKEAAETVKTGQVTYAVRATSYGDKNIADGDILCMLEGDIVHVEKDVQTGTQKLIDTMFQQDGGDFMSIYYGENIKKEEAEAMEAYVNQHYPDCEVEVLEGGQPLYYYVLSLE